MTISVAGSHESGKSPLVARIREVCAGDLTLLKARLAGLAVEPELLDQLRDAKWVEAPDYTTWTDSEGRRDRAKRQAAVEAAVDGDLLVLVIDGRQKSDQADVAFAQAWDRWFIEHPRVEAPPSLVVITGVEGAEFGNGWQPPYDWTAGTGAREIAVRARIDALRAILPPSFAEFVAVGLSDQHLHGVFEYVLPALVTQLHRAERTALLRRLHELGERSKVGRLVRQLGKQGRAVWSGLRARRKTPSASP